MHSLLIHTMIVRGVIQSGERVCVQHFGLRPKARAAVVQQIAEAAQKPELVD